jgi:tetratricopeptide (TPR) repeat protein
VTIPTPTISGRFYGRGKEFELFDKILGSPKGTLIIVGETGIGKSELVRRLLLQADQDTKSTSALAYLPASRAMLPNEPFTTILGSILDSVSELDQKARNIRRFKKVMRVLEKQSGSIIAGFVQDVTEKVVGARTVEALKEVVSNYRQDKTALESARSSIAAQPRSLVYLFNTVIDAALQSDQNLRIVLAFDRFEEAGEISWWILLDVLRSLKERVYVIIASRHLSDSDSKYVPKFLNECTTMDYVYTWELIGLTENEIAEWIFQERDVKLTDSQLSSIRRSSGGFPLVISQWIKTSKALDSAELTEGNWRKTVCDQIRYRLREARFDAETLHFLHQLSVLQFPPAIRYDSKAYEKLTRLESSVVGRCSELLASSWILNADRNQPWFIHHLVKLCVEDSIRDSESIELHSSAARFYEKLLNVTKRSGGKIPFSVAEACAYHFHLARKFRKSFAYNLTIGGVSLESYQYGIAVECFERSIEDAKSLHDDRGISRARLGKAMALGKYGKSDEALSLFEEGLSYYERVKDLRTQSRIHLDIGFVLRQRGDYYKAQNQFDLSLKIAEKIPNDKGILQALIELGVLGRLRASSDEAVELFKSAIVICRKIQDLASEARCLRELGNVASDRGELDDADKFYEQSLEIDYKVGDATKIAATLHELGIVATLRGEFDKAQGHLELSLKESQKIGDIENVAGINYQFGVLEFERKQYSKANTYFSETLDIAKRIGNQELLFKCLHELGLIARTQGRLEDAERYANQSMIIKRQMGYSVGVAKSLLQLALIAFDRSRFDLAEDYYLEALSIFKEAKLSAGIYSVAQGLAVLALKSQGSPRVADALVNCLDIVRRSGDDRLTGSVLYNLGIILKAVGRNDESVKFLSEAMVLIAKHDRSFSDTTTT